MRIKQAQRKDARPIALCGSCSSTFKVRYPSQTFCTQICFQQSVYINFINRWQAGIEDGCAIANASVSNYIRRYLKESRGEKCEQCGWSERNLTSGKIPIELDHIDGNHKNNKETNLRLLCPNCHSLTSTYKNLNKGNGRQNRRAGVCRMAEGT